MTGPRLHLLRPNVHMVTGPRVWRLQVHRVEPGLECPLAVHCRWPSQLTAIVRCLPKLYPTALVPLPLSSLDSLNTEKDFNQLAREVNRFKLHHRWPRLSVPDFHQQLVQLVTWQRTTAKPGSCPPLWWRPRGGWRGRKPPGSLGWRRERRCKGLRGKRELTWYQLGEGS